MRILVRVLLRSEKTARLLQDADVLAWNVRPASMARLGLSYDDVRAVNPRLIYCGMFGFGQDGPYASVPAYDPIIQGASGVAGLHERAFGEPRFVPYVMADRTSGLIAVQMIAMALFHRERTGEGQHLDICLLDTQVAMMANMGAIPAIVDMPLLMIWAFFGDSEME